MISWSSFVVTHEKGRHGLACPPSVDVSRRHREPGSEVLGYMLEAEVLLDVLLPLFSLPPRSGVALQRPDRHPQGVCVCLFSGSLYSIIEYE
jgi:hypothetical protein